MKRAGRWFLFLALALAAGRLVAFGEEGDVSNQLTEKISLLEKEVEDLQLTQTRIQERQVEIVAQLASLKIFINRRR